MEDRKLFFIDRNRDMYLSRVANKGNFKLHAQVDSAAWNDASELLIAIADAKLLTWTYPNMVYVDPGMALHKRHLETAEISLASIDCVDKLYFVLHVKSMASDERRNAELALYSVLLNLEDFSSTAGLADWT
ncbi:Intraflagellar Transport protein 80 [Phytophthora palmivora]|uniref:Intraflagellar Transport protein 80 n=1 Tax=Phytophthora palmivora TaxID=4796 RepID=A0A2P4YGP0_9STRA|nr:Intraflagellar Transport protein 80 [Phytophthora palmivora]